MTRSSASASNTCKFGVCGNRRLHRRRIELAVGLRPRPAHGRAFAAVQNAKLDAALVGDAAHEAVQSIDFPDQMALAQAADGRVAAHGADGGKAMRHQRGLRAHAGAGGRGLTAGMAAANHHNVEYETLWTLPWRAFSGGGGRGQKIRFCGMFHVKHWRRRYKHTEQLSLLPRFCANSARNSALLPLLLRAELLAAGAAEKNSDSSICDRPPTIRPARGRGSWAARGGRRRRSCRRRWPTARTRKAIQTQGVGLAQGLFPFRTCRDIAASSGPMRFQPKDRRTAPAKAR